MPKKLLKKQRPLFRATVQVSREQVSTSLEKFAHYFMEAEKHLVPLIVAEKMNPTKAMILIVMRANQSIIGKEAMTEDEIVGSMNMCLGLWKQGLFIPSKQYPHSLEATIAASEEVEA